MNANTPIASNQLSQYAVLLLLARRRQLSLTDLLKSVEALTASGQNDRIIELYKTWLAFNDANPLAQMIYFNYSVALNQAGDAAGAMNALRACLQRDPMFGAAYVNLGRTLEDNGLPADAVDLWRSFVEKTAESTSDRMKYRLLNLQHIGRVLENLGILEDAETVLWNAMELRPDLPETAQHWMPLRQRQCKWPMLQTSQHVSEKHLVDAMSPMTLACYADDPLFQLAKAYRYNRYLVGRPDTKGFPRPAPRMKTGTGKKVRVGYLSSDLRDHAVGFALREVLELHDKKTVEIYAYYCGEPRTNDESQDRIKKVVAGWRDIANVSDVDAARQIVEDKIDILIDVNGYTKHARAAIFAYRPAPVIVNFCGFPGSTGSPFHQYLITDALIVPPENEIYYSEKVLHIPCEQPVDRKRKVAKTPSRAEVGLPEDAFVYVCFNGMQKITEECFGRWMRILEATPDSVLWLLGGEASVNKRLADLAEKQGIAPERLIFAQKAGNPEHLARIGLADLFLDTFPYGAHSTAADAITMGTPVLTVPGKTFAARFCASVVAAAGIPELVCKDPEDYVARAIGFAKDRKTLEAVKKSLQEQRETCALRDMPALARRLEELYWQMQGEAERGETPVPDLRNLDVYYEVGAEMLQAGLGFEDEASYRARYRQKLEEWNEYAPLLPDGRLWQ